jgi:hypothetical protein
MTVLNACVGRIATACKWLLIAAFDSELVSEQTVAAAFARWPRLKAA